jgi:sugar O-acyltransferase (sialic acid O-acetyltransferase NeuD family)
VATDKDKLILHGGGEHAKVVLDGLLCQGVNVIAIFDPKYNGHLYGVPHLGSYNPYFEPQAKALVAIGDNLTRKKAVDKTTHACVNFIHESAVVSPNARLGVGVMIMHRGVVQADTRIGNHVIINTSASIDHDCVIQDFAHIAPGAVLCGRVSVGEGALVGAGAVVLPGIEIGAWAVIGAGAVVTRPVPDGKVVKGNPARS